MGRVDLKMVEAVDGGMAVVVVMVDAVVKPIRPRKALGVANETRATFSVSSAIGMVTMPIDVQGRRRRRRRLIMSRR